MYPISDSEMICILCNSYCRLRYRENHKTESTNNPSASAAFKFFKLIEIL